MSGLPICNTKSQQIVPIDNNPRYIWLQKKSSQPKVVIPNFRIFNFPQNCGKSCALDQVKFTKLCRILRILIILKHDHRWELYWKNTIFGSDLLAATDNYMIRRGLKIKHLLENLAHNPYVLFFARVYHFNFKSWLTIWLWSVWKGQYSNENLNVCMRNS